MIGVGSPAPDFSLPGVYGSRRIEVHLRDVRDRWVILFFYPADFSFVCPTEVKGFHLERDAFRREGAALLGVGAAQERVPAPAALLMGVSFALGAIIVLVPYFLVGGYWALGTAVGVTAFALFAVGLAKAILAGTRLWVSGLEFLLVAAAAATVGYLLGLFLPPGLAS